eukprot:NODE_1334_length_634_cov_557.919658_g936_i0.p1 GENE.NODE_1334_length_634_cov_557.919658_g936_i0~~NODE_1334_length_634_cov_557.919658_g936_i0.p1  ORF type:complete len:135 (+),score=69.37 NODE_1334_length_634_cov_557.919658_g936_i0:31-435(+)
MGVCVCPCRMCVCKMCVCVWICVCVWDLRQSRCAHDAPPPGLCSAGANCQVVALALNHPAPAPNPIVPMVIVRSDDIDKGGNVLALGKVERPRWLDSLLELVLQVCSYQPSAPTATATAEAEFVIPRGRGGISM